MPQGLRVLIVDDDPAVVRALRRVLRVAHDVDGCTSPDDVLERLRAGERYDALLVDYRLADRTAAALVEQITRITPDQATRVVIITGDESVRVGAFGRELLTLRKPVGTRELEHVLEAVVARTRETAAWMS